MIRIAYIRAVALMLGLVLAGAAAQGALAGARDYTPRSSYVPRSGYQGVSPGTFGRSDRLQGRIELDRLQSDRFRALSREQARQRQTLRELRPPVTERRQVAPTNRLTDRLYPDLEPLGHLPGPGVSRADRVLDPPSPLDPPVEVLPLQDGGAKVEPFSHIDRNMR